MISTISFTICWNDLDYFFHHLLIKKIDGSFWWVSQYFTINTSCLTVLKPYTRNGGTRTFLDLFHLWVHFGYRGYWSDVVFGSIWPISWYNHQNICHGMYFGSTVVSNQHPTDTLTRPSKIQKYDKIWKTFYFICGFKLFVHEKAHDFDFQKVYAQAFILVGMSLLSKGDHKRALFDQPPCTRFLPKNRFFSLYDILIGNNGKYIEINVNNFNLYPFIFICIHLFISIFHLFWDRRSSAPLFMRPKPNPNGFTKSGVNLPSIPTLDLLVVRGLS